MREVLLQCPAYNGTLDRWDTTKFTWQEKDMDVTMDLAQQAGLVLPLSGQTDQLIKLLSAKDVKALLYGEECEYLGMTVKPMTKEEGRLG
jgi:3-hydroxyisobutyrate dehydrogenase